MTTEQLKRMALCHFSDAAVKKLSIIRHYDAYILRKQRLAEMCLDMARDNEQQKSGR